MILTLAAAEPVVVEMYLEVTQLGQDERIEVIYDQNAPTPEPARRLNRADKWRVPPSQHFVDGHITVERASGSIRRASCR
jgi:hypothetical protein